MEARAMSAIRYHRPEFDAERGRYVRLSPRAFEAVSRMPRALAGRVRREWLKRANGAGCKHAARGLMTDGRPDAADCWLHEFARPLFAWSATLPLDASDVDIREEAERLSKGYFDDALKLHWQVGSIGRLGDEMGVRAAEVGRQQYVAMRRGLTALAARAEADGVAVSRFLSGKYEAESVLGRLCDKGFVGRQLRKGFGRARENLIRSAFGGVHRRAALYVSDDAMETWRGQRRRNMALLEAMELINEMGERFDLVDIVAASESNPRNRNAGLMVRIAGFEKIALDLGHVGEFVTMTCPSRFHARMSASGAVNPKFDGSSPRDAANYLQKVWARIRAALKDEGIPIYGFRVAEPHHDGCPHWHGLFFMPSEARKRFREIVAMHLCREDRDELGLGYFLSNKARLGRAREIQAGERRLGGAVRPLSAICVGMLTEKEFWYGAKYSDFQAVQARVDFKAIDWGRGSAACCIAKYIVKNIDGNNAYGESVGFDDEAEGADVTKTVERVLCWASTHGIRQFQQVGGPPVGVWRELRRLKDLSGDGDIVRAAHAADVGDWGKFVMVMGGVDCKRDERPVLLYKEECREPNRYGEPRADRVRGVVEPATGVYAVSRVHEWVLGFKRGGEAVAHGGAAAAWTCVNNCRKNEAAAETAAIYPNVIKKDGDYDWEAIDVLDWLAANGRPMPPGGVVSRALREEYRDCIRRAREEFDSVAGLFKAELDKVMADVAAAVKEGRQMAEKRKVWQELTALSAGFGAVCYGQRLSKPKPKSDDEISGERPRRYLPMPKKWTTEDVIKRSEAVRKGAAEWLERMRRM